MPYIFQCKGSLGGMNITMQIREEGRVRKKREVASKQHLAKQKEGWLCKKWKRKREKGWQKSKGIKDMRWTFVKNDSNREKKMEEPKSRKEIKLVLEEWVSYI